MKFTERLEGTELEGDMKAWIVCAIIDWCRSNGINNTPTEREWCSILGCFPKGKARRGEDKKGYLPQSQVHKLLSDLDSHGILALIGGRGRQRNTFDMPTNLLADKKAAYEKRKETWKQTVWTKLKDEVDQKRASIEGIRLFFVYWSEADDDWNMRWESYIRDKGVKTFYIGSMWNGWKNKLAVQEQPQGTNQAEAIQRSLELEQKQKSLREERRNKNNN